MSVYVFLLARSHKYKYQWIIEVGVNYDHAIIRDALERILGDYKYTGNEISFVRSDADTRFVPLKGWLHQIGLRFKYLRTRVNYCWNTSIGQASMTFAKEKLRMPKL